MHSERTLKRSPQRGRLAGMATRARVGGAGHGNPLSRWVRIDGKATRASDGQEPGAILSPASTAGNPGARPTGARANLRAVCIARRRPIAFVHVAPFPRGFESSGADGIGCADDAEPEPGPARPPVLRRVRVHRRVNSLADLVDAGPRPDRHASRRSAPMPLRWLALRQRGREVVEPGPAGEEEAPRRGRQVLARHVRCGPGPGIHRAPALGPLGTAADPSRAAEGGTLLLTAPDLYSPEVAGRPSLRRDQLAKVLPRLGEAERDASPAGRDRDGADVRRSTPPRETLLRSGTTRPLVGNRNGGRAGSSQRRRLAADPPPGLGLTRTVAPDPRAAAADPAADTRRFETITGPSCR